MKVSETTLPCTQSSFSSVAELVNFNSYVKLTNMHARFSVSDQYVRRYVVEKCKLPFKGIPNHVVILAEYKLLIDCITVRSCPEQLEQIWSSVVNVKWPQGMLCSCSEHKSM